MKLSAYRLHGGPHQRPIPMATAKFRGISVPSLSRNTVLGFERTIALDHGSAVALDV